MADNDTSIRIGVQDDTQQPLQQMIANWKQSGDQLADAISKSFGHQAHRN